MPQPSPSYPNVPTCHHVEDQASSRVQGQFLLSALRAVIVPIVQTVLPNAKGLDNVTLGPEAAEFLVALQKYVACIVRGQSRAEVQAVMTRVIDTEELPPKETHAEGTKTDDKWDAKDERVVLRQLMSFLRTESFAGPFRPVHFVENNLMISASPQPETSPPVSDKSHLLTEALQELRTKVFNEMPIRLLYFQKRGSKLAITLLDRPQVYELLAQQLSENTPNGTYKNPSLEVSWIARYAILSHTWIRSASGEVTYGDWYKGAFSLNHAGYRKLVDFCRVTKEKHNISLGWMDTICVDKSSSSELDESIRSMYKWYQNAKVCVTYLAETTSISDMDRDPWFTRGWTLQELLAPTDIKFYGHDWNPLTNRPLDKMDAHIQERIQSATTITKTELQDSSRVSISRKMQWAANRQVTREEDSAYSLMGIFGINMSIAYGEGAETAFVRLVKEILSTSKSDILDLFNWAGGIGNSHSSVLLPSRPQLYLQRRDIKHPSTLIEPLSLTHLGLRVPVLILPALETLTPRVGYTPIGVFYATISLINLNVPERPTTFYNILDTQAFKMSSHDDERTALAILNCGGGEADIIVPENCFAVAFKYHGDVLLTPLTAKEMISTTFPITFLLHSKLGRPDNVEGNYSIKRSELKRHMMQFLNMYF